MSSSLNILEIIDLLQLSLKDLIYEINIAAEIWTCAYLHTTMRHVCFSAPDPWLIVIDLSWLDFLRKYFSLIFFLKQNNEPYKESWEEVNLESMGINSLHMLWYECIICRIDLTYTIFVSSDVIWWCDRKDWWGIHGTYECPEECQDIA